MTTVNIVLLGPMQISHAEAPAGRAAKAPIQPACPTRRVAHLLAYLLLGGREFYQRDELADVLWGEQGIERARRCLSTAVWRLRQIIEPAPVPHGSYITCRGGEVLGFNWSSAHRVDALVFEARLDDLLRRPVDTMTSDHAARLDAALELYCGDLLAGLQDDWTLRERDRFAARYLDGLSHLMRYHLHSGDVRRGIELGERVLDRDPLREDVHRDLMRLRARAGQRSQAISQYRACCEVLARELRVEPSIETRETFHELCGHDDVGSRQLHRATGPVTAREALLRLRVALEEVERARALVERLMPTDPRLESRD